MHTSGMLLRQLDCMSDVVLETCFLYALSMREPTSVTSGGCSTGGAGGRARAAAARASDVGAASSRASVMNNSKLSVPLHSYSSGHSQKEAPLVEEPLPPLPELAMQGLHSAIRLSRMTAIVKCSCVS